MLKIPGAILFTLLYLITVTGFALNLHYCGKLLTAVKIDAPAKGCNDPMACKMKCCKDKQIIIKIKDAHQTVPVCFTAKLFRFQIVPQFADFTFNRQPVVIITAFEHIPPNRFLNDTPFFIKHCTFRI